MTVVYDCEPKKNLMQQLIVCYCSLFSVFEADIVQSFLGLNFSISSSGDGMA